MAVESQWRCVGLVSNWISSFGCPANIPSDDGIVLHQILQQNITASAYAALLSRHKPHFAKARDPDQGIPNCLPGLAPSASNRVCHTVTHQDTMERGGKRLTEKEFWEKVLRAIALQEANGRMKKIARQRYPPFEPK
ncbi:hypothetical protein SMMN14_05780 [Sphaerulina musiva]